MNLKSPPPFSVFVVFLAPLWDCSGLGFCGSRVGLSVSAFACCPVHVLGFQPLLAGRPRWIFCVFSCLPDKMDLAFLGPPPVLRLATCMFVAVGPVGRVPPSPSSCGPSPPIFMGGLSLILCVSLGLGSACCSSIPPPAVQAPPVPPTINNDQLIINYLSIN